MKKRKLAALVLALTLGLTGCSGETMEESAWVKGELDGVFLGTFSEEYLQTCGLTEEEAQEARRAELEVEADDFIYYYGMEYVTEEQREEIIDLCGEIYAKASYTVQDAVEGEKGTHTVEIFYEPLDIHTRMVDGWDEFLSRVDNRFPDDNPFAMSGAKRERWMEDEYYPVYNRAVINRALSKLKQSEYLDRASVTVEVSRDESGRMTMSHPGFSTFGQLFVEYP